MIRTLLVAVIGAGLMRRRHGVACRSVPGVELVAMADSDPKMRAAVERDLGVTCQADWQDKHACNAGP